jgi:tetratricopeptide (TPR) repeat protein
MNNKNRILLFILINITLLSMSCSTFRFGNKNIDINGMIYDFSNKPVAYCEIVMGKSYKSSTDINGRFTLPKIPYGNYTITVHKNGYETYSDEVLIRKHGQIIYLRIPSQNQLLNLADEALTAMNFEVAEEYLERAYQIDKNNIEMLFYYSTIKFRQYKYDEAITFLVIAKNLGSKDLYIDKFLTILRELSDEESKK